MFAIATRSARHIASSVTLPRALAARAFSIDSKLKGKEKVEENRYMREQEKKFFENKRAELAESEKKAFQETLAPAMAQAEAILKSTNDSVSHDGLEALARWKSGL